MPSTRPFVAWGASLLTVAAAFSGTSVWTAPDARPQATSAEVLSVPGLREIASPAASGSAGPQLSLAPDGSILLSWLEPGKEGTTRFRFSRFDGTAWTAPVTVEEGDSLFVNWADVPSVIQLGSGRLAAHWLQKSAASPYAYDVRLRTSDDDGRRWSEIITPHRDGTQTEHGFVSMVDMGGGTLGLVWLDGREMGGGGHDTHGGGHGSMTVRAATLGPGLAITNEAVLDDRVCECCPTAAVRTREGLVAAYRNRGENEVRDIFVARFTGERWLPGRAVHEDNWRIAACPVNGPALATDGTRIAIAWFTAEKDTPRVMAAFSTDGGATFGRPTRVDDASTLGRVDADMLPDGSLLVGWIEFRRGGSEFRVRRLGPDGTRGASMRVSAMSSERASGYPRLVRSGDTVLFAWTETGQATRVRLAAAPVSGL